MDVLEVHTYYIKEEINFGEYSFEMPLDDSCLFFLQAVAKNDSVDVKYCGWLLENNTFGKV